MTANALEAQAITKSFAGLTVLDGVSLSVAAGERRGILGPNGAGKTTLFNVLSGFLAPTSGRVVLNGVDVTEEPAHLRSRAGLGRTFQVAALFDSLTVLENVLLGLACRNRWERRFLRRLTGDEALHEEAERLLMQAGLWQFCSADVGTLAYGHRRILEIVMALTNKTSVLLLDEPAAGLSGEETLRLMQMLEQLDPALTILLIEHDMDVMFHAVGSITVLDRGSVLLEGSVEEIRESPLVHERYLGTSTVG